MTRNTQVGITAAAIFIAAGVGHAQSFMESFDDITLLPGLGWYEQNNSGAPGLIGYFQGNTGEFPPEATSGYLAVNFNSTTGENTISNWMVAPSATLHNGDTFVFWTRTTDAPEFADRLQVRMSTNGTSTNVGTAPEDVGDFTTLLLDINPDLTLTGYPTDWTRYTLTLSGLPTGGAPGRIAFRYYVPDGGPLGANSSYVGIDEVAFTAGGGGGPSPCYANCDGSTATPILNVNDFICFQQRYAAGDSYANCDGSTNAPVLNVNDFICFQAAFASGCTAP
jgi:hypothetical protein